MPEPAHLALLVAACLVPVAVALALWRTTARRRAVLVTLKAATASTPSPSRSRDRRAQRRRPLVAALDRGIDAVAQLAHRLSPPGYVEGVQRRLTLAGHDAKVDLSRFLAARLATVALVPVAFVLVRVSPVPRLDQLLIFLVLAFLLVLGPEAFLNRRVGARQEQIRRDLPAIVELLMISTEAGLGFDQALGMAHARVPGPLSDELSRLLGEVRMGAPRTSALEALDRRTDVSELRSFIMALVQAETFGVSIGSILRSQAEEVRVAQRQHVQELAQKAPVKMLFPLVFCVLPALFIVVVGPAAIEIYRTIIK